MLEDIPISLVWNPKDPQTHKMANLQVLDQRLLPHEETFIECTRYQQVCDCIATLAVRGAPAIGIAGAYALALWAINEWPAEARKKKVDPDSLASFKKAFDQVSEEVASVRPTAVNLRWAVNECRAAMDASFDTMFMYQSSGEDKHFYIGKIAAEVLEAAAVDIQKEDAEICERVSKRGAQIFHELAQKLGRPLRVETHCNAGSIATARYGTALGALFFAHAAGDIEKVWVDETRPLDQGARLTTWELGKAGVPYTLICDNMAGSIMAAGKVDAVIVGTDRVCANGDIANKIGTYPLAVLADAHGVPFYVASPRSTFDKDLASGDLIQIEERDAQEVRCAPQSDRLVAPEGCDVYNPAFDVTPARLIDGIIFEDELWVPREELSE